MRSWLREVASSTRSFQSPPAALKTWAPLARLVVGDGRREDVVVARPRGLGLRELGVGAHQLYDLRWSGGGMVAPLYSTGIPPSG